MKKKTGDVQRYKCVACKATFNGTETRASTVGAVEEFMDLMKNEQYVRDEAWIQSKIAGKKRFVITSAQSNTAIDRNFLESINKYCMKNYATLLIVPIRYRNPTSPDQTIEDEYPKEIEEFLFENNIKIHPKLKVLGSLKIAATAEYPLTGLAPISKGDSIVIGHNQLQMTTLPVQANDDPIIMTTTGTISEKNYSASKQGYKAEFNHSASAVVVELDGEMSHIRHLNFDGTGFYDFDIYYSKDGAQHHYNAVTAVITGDEHAIFADPDVKEATYGPNGLVKRLSPKYIVRHDVLDCYAVSHHHNKNILTKFKKYVTGENDMAKELDATIDFIVETTPKGSTNILVPSNHTDHLTKWLNEADVKNEQWNARLYHWLMYNVLHHIETQKTIPDPFELYSRKPFVSQDCSVEFVTRSESYKIHDIEVAIHGDRGANGARGSREQFAKLPSKTIVGHSHSPGIEKGCYQVGTSSKIKLEYNDGPSSWMNTHCLIYKNGKRQLVNILKGRWRAA